MIESKTQLKDQTIEQLKDLIRVDVDAAEGFEAAAKQVENERLAAMFREDSARRRAMAGELQRFVELNDDEMELSGSLKGRLHRWWIGLRGTVQDGDEHAVLAEAERGEDAIKACYEDAIKENPGSAVNDVLHAHLRSIKETHDRVRNMRDARTAKS